MAFHEPLDLLSSRAQAAFEAWRGSSRHQRRRLMEAWKVEVAAASQELALLMVEETGKPISLAKSEMVRALATLDATWEAIGSFGEEAIPYDLMDGAEGCRAVLRRFPRGVVAAITPFNFPVNLALHKLAPAMGAGCAVIWKPCPQAPRTSERLWSSFEAARVKAGAPDLLLQLRHAEPAEAQALVQDPAVAMVSFTGSEKVGLHLRHLLPEKPVLLELGGNAAVVLDEGIAAGAVAKALAPASVAAAGQSCCKAQRFYVHERLWDAFVPAFVEAVKALPVGDPMDPSTVVGPLIDEATARRLEASVARALGQGAKALLEGTRQGRTLHPVILTDVPETDPLQCEELFGPVSVLTKVSSFEEGLDRAAATRFGLRASAYSRDARHLRLAGERLKAGGVLLNLPPTFRLDAAPFGGLAMSGNGFEGPRWAMEAFSEARLIVEGPAL